MPKIYRRNCDTCGKYYEKAAKYFCSHQCRANSEWLQKQISETKKGRHYSQDTEFKKGHIPWSKNKICPNLANENNSQWKGDKAGYVAIHIWVKHHKGQPQVCEHCGVTAEEKRLQWANVDHKYCRNLNDYIQLCSSCHKLYDLKKT